MPRAKYITESPRWSSLPFAKTGERGGQEWFLSKWWQLFYLESLEAKFSRLLIRQCKDSNDRTDKVWVR